MPLTEAGFIRLTYDDILDSKMEKARELFGADIELSDQTPLGKFIRINAYDLATVYELLEAVYFARFPNTASGTALDRLCVFAAIHRNSATEAEHIVSVTGTAGYVIPAGFLVGTESGINFANKEDTEIPESGTVEITVVCEQGGTIGNVSSADINTIVNPDASVESVQGVSAVVLGEEHESDTALRNRFAQAVQGAGSSNADAIRAAVMRVPTVEAVGIIVNETNEIDSGNRPPHSFECYVTGGENYHTEIAQTIFEKKPIGIKTYGSIGVEILDTSENRQTIYFSHTENVNITVKVTVKTNTRYQSDGSEQIKSNIQDYINGLFVGDDVVLNKLFGKIFAVDGVEDVVSVQMSKDGQTFVSENIAISDTQIARCNDVAVVTV